MDYNKIMGFLETLRKIHPDMYIVVAQQQPSRGKNTSWSGPLEHQPKRVGQGIIYVDHVNLIT